MLSNEEDDVDGDDEEDDGADDGNDDEDEEDEGFLMKVFSFRFVSRKKKLIFSDR